MTGPGPIDVAGRPVEAAVTLARAFGAGRRLAVLAPGGADHAHHVAVEFVHPVIAGTRPLPAVAVDDPGEVGADDVVLVIGAAPGPGSADLVIDDDGRCDIGDDTATVRAYHLLWELVQMALEHPGLVAAGGGDGPTAGGRVDDTTGFLYPFLDGAETDGQGLRVALAASAEAKVAESDRLVADALAANRDALDAVAGALSTAAAAGRRVHVAGNGGSATDAARLARRLRSRGVAATSLAADYAVVTALANDVGVDRLFARQVEALASPGDVLIGLSTSGSSPNLLAAFAEAGRRGLVTVAVSGYGGGPLAEPGVAEHRLVVESASVHRIQEAQAALLSRLVQLASSPVAARPDPALPGSVGGGR